MIDALQVTLIMSVVVFCLISLDIYREKKGSTQAHPCKGGVMAERLTQITLVEKGVHQLLPGEVTYDKNAKAWYIGCPSDNCGVGNLGGHQVTYDEQVRLFTVSPSILCGCGAHYFVERNQIRWC